MDPRTPIDESDVEEIAKRFATAGIVAPADRAAGAYAAARRLLEARHWLRGVREAAAEPAHVFDVRAQR